MKLYLDVLSIGVTPAHITQRCARNVRIKKLCSTFVEKKRKTALKKGRF